MTILRTRAQNRRQHHLHVARGPWTSSRKVSVGPRGAWVITPSQLHGLGATQRLWDSCCNGACDLSSAQVAGTGLAHACSNGGHGWSQPNVSSLRDQCPHNLHWQVRIRRICGARLSRGRDASRRRWRSLALWLLCEPLLLCAPCATAEHRDPPHRRLGAAWFSSKHAVCLLAKKTARLSRAAP